MRAGNPVTAPVPGRLRTTSPVCGSTAGLAGPAPAEQDVTPVLAVGGPRPVPREQAPLGRRLPYGRARGEHPAPTGLALDVVRRGWQVRLPARSLGDTVLGMAAVAALHHITRTAITYHGPRPALFARSALPITSQHANGDHVLTSSTGGGSDPLQFTVTPEYPSTWLELLDEQQVLVHAALPMRYYLELEQQLGRRLPADSAPAPGYRTSVTEPCPGRVVFVATTSRPDRKNYGVAQFGRVACELAAIRPDATFALITPPDLSDTELAEAVAQWPTPVDVLGPVDAADAVDVFARAELVVGNDTGLTHLAALTDRPDGTGPHVLGLYSRHAHTKWITGRARHSALATPFSAMLAQADRCPVRDDIDDTVWGRAAEITAIAPDVVAYAAASLAGWRR